MRLASNQKKFKLYSRSVSCETAGNQHLLHLFFTCDSELAASRCPRPGRARVITSCVNHYFIYTSLAYEASSFWSQVSGFWQSRPSGQHIQQTARLVNFYPKHSPRFPSYLRTQDSESQMVNDFNSSDGLATEGLS